MIYLLNFGQVMFLVEQLKCIKREWEIGYDIIINKYDDDDDSFILLIVRRSYLRSVLNV